MSDEGRELHITLGLEKLRHLFDLAVDSPTVCSGSFDTIDVELLREIARMIGVNPADITPSEFASQYPHAFIKRRVHAEPIRVFAYPGAHHMRTETAQEQRERMQEERNDLACRVRRCGKPADDPIHQAECVR